MSVAESRLPPPDEGARRHSAEVRDAVLRAVEAAGGWLSFEDYMDLVLYGPGLGYYSAGAHKLGPGGDFTTAPEISAVFSRCLARFCAPALEALGHADSVILEVGGGSGVMAAELLNELGRLDTLPGAYLLLEVSPDLRERQQTTIAERAPDHYHRVSWLERLPAPPVTGIVIANEVMDAFPVIRFERLPSGWAECGVGRDETGALVDVPRPASQALAESLEALERVLPAPLPPGYRSELNRRLGPWVSSLAGCLRQGCMLLIDYGLARHEYYHPERGTGTLICHYRHRAHEDPYLWPGLQDITAWVDFTAVAEAAEGAGWVLGGYTTQANFLMDTDLEQVVASLDSDEVSTHYRLAQEVKRLMLPSEMGERFKAMALTRGLDDPALRGFRMRDLRGRLWLPR